MNGHKSRFAVVMLAVSIAFSGTLIGAPAALAAKLNIGVAPSPNGYVMAGQPTQVAVNQTAKIYRNVNGKWMLVGTGAKNRAVPITFNGPGVYSLRAKPRKGKARVVKVSVYDYFGIGVGGPNVAIGGQVFAGSLTVVGSWQTSGSRNVSISASRGCVNVDVGVRETQPARNASYEATIDVFSTGAPAWSSGPQFGTDGFAASGIPISGDAAIEFAGTGGTVTGSVKALCVS
jgi:hypothetical protein